MNFSIELPSGIVVNLERFIALFPQNKEERNIRYWLILEGYADKIGLDSNDAIAIKKFLAQYSP